jgi:catechol 2,3-dioxygenase-like lactoylglutathione lyase family enzyme
MRFAVDRLDHLVLTCRDVETTASWYQRVLGMEREEFGPHNRTALRFGGQKINLDTASDSRATAAAPTPGSHNLCRHHHPAGGHRGASARLRRNHRRGPGCKSGRVRADDLGLLP